MASAIDMLTGEKKTFASFCADATFLNRSNANWLFPDETEEAALAVWVFAASCENADRVFPSIVIPHTARMSAGNTRFE
jgi:hypothetical protein